MSFPTIPTAAGSRILSVASTTGGATNTFPSLSGLTKNAGDRLIAIVVLYDGNTTDAEFSSWGGGFTERADRAGTSSISIGVAEKISDGTETGTFTVTSSDASANDRQMILLSIPGAHASTPIEVGLMQAQSAGTGISADIPALSPSWGAADTLWIAVSGCGETNTTGSFTGVDGAPTNYGSLYVTGISEDVVGGLEAGVAFRQLNAATEDPGAFTVDTSNARNAALLIAVPPPPADQLIEGSSSLVVSSSATVDRETFVEGSSSLVVSASASADRETFIEGSSALVVSSSATVRGEHELAGASNLVVSSSATAVREAVLAGASGIVVSSSATFDGGSPVQEIGGSSALVVSSSATAVREAVLAGASGIDVSSSATAVREAVLAGASGIVVSSSATIGLGEILSLADITGELRAPKRETRARDRRGARR